MKWKRKMLVQFSSASVEVTPMQGHSHDGARHVPGSPGITTSGIPHLTSSWWNTWPDN